MQKNEIKKITEKRKEILLYAFALSLLFLFFAFFPNVDLTVHNPNQAKPLATIIEKNNTPENIGFDEIFDYSPLFITTRWNSTFKPVPTATPITWNFEISKEKYATGLGSEKFLFNNDDIKRGRSSIHRSLLRNVFSSYARTEVPTLDKTDTIAYSVVDLSTGKTIKSDFVKCDLSKKMFSIAEYKVSIEVDGWVMKPLVLQSSGNESIDDNLANMLTKSKLLKQVPHGDYKVLFVP